MVFCFLVLVVSTSAIDCLETLISEMACCLSRETLNSTHSLTYLFTFISSHLLCSVLCTQFSFTHMSSVTCFLFFIIPSPPLDNIPVMVIVWRVKYLLSSFRPSLQDI